MFKAFFSIGLFCLLCLGGTNSPWASSSFSSDDLEEIYNTPSTSSSLEENEVSLDPGAKKALLREFFKNFEPGALGYNELSLILDTDTGSFNDVQGMKTFSTTMHSLHEMKKKGLKEGCIIEYWARNLQRQRHLPPKDQCSIEYLEHSARFLRGKKGWGSAYCHPYKVQGPNKTYIFCLMELPMEAFSKQSKKRKKETRDTLTETRKGLIKKERRQSGTVFDPYGVGAVLSELEQMYLNPKKVEKKVEKFHREIEKEKGRKKSARDRRNRVSPVKRAQQYSRSASSSVLSPLTFKNNEEIVDALRERIKFENEGDIEVKIKGSKSGRNKKVKKLNSGGRKKARQEKSPGRSKIKRLNSGRKKKRSKSTRDKGAPNTARLESITENRLKTARKGGRKISNNLKRTQSSGNLRNHITREERGQFFSQSEVH
jgi:hypothetical protein